MKNNILTKISKTVALVSTTALMTAGTTFTSYATDDLESLISSATALESLADEIDESTASVSVIGNETSAEASSETSVDEDIFAYLEEIEAVGDSYKEDGEIPEDKVSEAVDAVHQKAIDLKNEGVVESAVRRTSSVYITFVGGYEYTWEAGAEPSEETGELEDKKQTLQSSSGSSESSTEETTRWSPEDPDNKTQQFLIAVPTGTVRYEFIYSAGSETPSISFLSTTAKTGEEYIAGNDVKNDGEDGFKFVTKTGLTIDGHDDFRYMVVYISNTDDPGRWTMTVSVPSAMTEVIAVSSEVPEDWENLSSDTITKPYGVIFWYIDATRSKYKDTPIATINELISAKTSLSNNDLIKSTEPVEEEINYVVLFTMLGIFVAIIVAVVVTLIILKRKKKNNEEYRSKREAIVRKENDKVRRKKASENDELDEMLNDYSDEYIDDDDLSAYMTVDDTEENDESIFTEENDDTGVYEGEYQSAQRVKEMLNDEKPAWDKPHIPAWEESSPVEEHPKEDKSEKKDLDSALEEMFARENMGKAAVQKTVKEDNKPSFKAEPINTVKEKSEESANEAAPAWLKAASGQSNDLLF